MKHGMNIHDATQKMMENKMSKVAVVYKDNTLAGMFSALDHPQKIVSAVYNGNAPGVALVKDVMTKDVEVNKLVDDIGIEHSGGP